MNVKQRLLSALREIDVRVGGDRPWDLTVHDDRLYRRVGREGLMGLGDAYVDGWWDCPSLDVLFDRALRADLPRPAGGRQTGRLAVTDLESRFRRC